MKGSMRVLALWLALIMMLGTMLAACTPSAGNPEQTTDTDTESGEGTTTPDTQPDHGFTGEEYTLPLEDGYNQITF